MLAPDLHLQVDNLCDVLLLTLYGMFCLFPYLFYCSWTFAVIRVCSAWKAASKLSHVWMMQNFTVDQCGPVHITMGDGGNIEGVCKCLALLYLNLPLP